MGKRIDFPDDVLQAIINDYKEGVYSDNILQKYKLNRKVLYRILTENNIPRRLFNKTIFPDALVEAVIKDYQSGLEQNELSQRYDINRYFVARILKENGIQMRSQTNRSVPDNIKQSILDDYKAGLGFKRIYQKYNVAQTLLDKLLTENEITRHPRHGNGATRNVFNFNFFNEDTPIVAYWAGFAMADGSINKPKAATPGACYRLVISLHKQDVAHLQQFLVDTEHCLSHTAIKPKPSNQQVSVILSHPFLLSSLERWGVVPRKTYNFVEPSVPEHLLKYYLLGWFDGDGHLRTKKYSETFQVTGNLEALHWYSNALQAIGFHGRVQIWQSSSQRWGRLAVGGSEQVRTLVNIFSPETNFCLKRKWERGLEMDRSPLKNCKICAKNLYRRNRTDVCAYCQRLIPRSLKQIIYTSGWDDSCQALLPAELMSKSTIASISPCDAPLSTNLLTT